MRKAAGLDKMRKNISAVNIKIRKSARRTVQSVAFP